MNSYGFSRIGRFPKESGARFSRKSDAYDSLKFLLITAPSTPTPLGHFSLSSAPYLVTSWRPDVLTSWRHAHIWLPRSYRHPGQTNCISVQIREFPSRSQGCPVHSRGGCSSRASVRSRTTLVQNLPRQISPLLSFDSTNRGYPTRAVEAGFSEPHDWRMPINIFLSQIWCQFRGSHISSRKFSQRKTLFSGHKQFTCESLWKIHLVNHSMMHGIEHKFLWPTRKGKKEG
jgi:hypothetical protein